MRDEIQLDDFSPGEPSPVNPQNPAASSCHSSQQSFKGDHKRDF